MHNTDMNTVKNTNDAFKLRRMISMFTDMTYIMTTGLRLPTCGSRRFSIPPLLIVSRLWRLHRQEVKKNVRNSPVNLSGRNDFKLGTPI